MTEKLSTKERKKAFDSVFKQKILPFFEQEGFRQVTKTSKRIYKTLSNGLSVYVYFEYKTFGSGFYDIGIAYYDDEIGQEIDGVYLACPIIKKPHLKGNNVTDLNGSVDDWLNEIKSKIIHFIDQHATHKAILNSTEFYFAKFNEVECKELLKRKSNGAESN